MKKICFVNAIKGTAQSFLVGHFQNLRQRYEVHYVACDVNDGEDPSFPGIICHKIDIRRPISLVADLRAVWNLYRLMHKEHFDAVHSITPKAGLTCAIAAKLAGIQIRCHTITGQVWATKTSVMRKMLRAIDHLIISLNNHLFVDGEAQRQYLIHEGFLTEDNSSVLANGSLRGVDLTLFNPSLKVREQYRKELGIEDNQFVFAFLGRLTFDKGIRELLQAFDRLAASRPKDHPYLLLVGPDEENMTKYFAEYSHIKSEVNFCHFGPTPNPHLVMQAADAFVLPTYREGFPQSPLEASALALPVIISDIYGTKASIIDKVTGLRCLPQNVDSLYEAMLKMISNPSEAKEMGLKGRKYIEEKYAHTILEKAWLDLYEELLK